VVLIDVNILVCAVNKDARPGLFRNPLPVGTAFDLIDFWLERTCVSIIHPGPRHRTILRGLLEPLGTGGNLTADAHLAALALENRAELCSSDGDFLQFPGLKCRNPLL
jgi:predicted nucleic acid-binding protein